MIMMRQKTMKMLLRGVFALSLSVGMTAASAVCAYSFVPDAASIVTNSQDQAQTQGQTQIRVLRPELGPGPGQGQGQTEPVSTELTLSFAGDCSIGKLQIHDYSGTFDQYYDANGPAYFFQHVRPVFDADDLTMANFEGVLTNSNNRVPKGFNIKGRPEFIQVLTESGIDAVSFANNHKIDYGRQGIADTVAAFESIGLPYAYDDHTALIPTEKGIHVGLVAVNYVHDAEDVSHATEYLAAGIESLKNQEADVIIAMIHWGEESVHYPNADQQAIGHQAIDLGADVVVGCHAHVLQGVEYYKDRPILYGMGNFCFGGNRNPRVKETMIAQAKLSFTDKELTKADLHILPARLSTATGHNDYCPVLLEGAEGQAVIQNMNAYSAPFGISFDEEGNVVR